jgi:starch-binding outer membrane protein, SusD/RagB family
MMKYYKYFYLVLFSFITPFCKKSFLDVADNGNITQQQYVIDLKSTGEYLNGIYILLSQNFYSGVNQIYPEVIADNIKPVTATSSTLATHYKWSQYPDMNSSATNNINNNWTQGYQIVRTCSFAIEKAEEFRSQDPAKADNIRAEALAIRALVHFVLVNIFAQPFGYTTDASHTGIPYVNTSDWKQPAYRHTVAEVYENIISDLNNALPLFKSGVISVLSMNRNAAKALLARICLFKGDYQTAKNLAKEVGNAVPIMTGSNYPSKLFTLQESEALFQLLPAYSGVNNSIYQTNFQGRYYYAGSSTLFLATGDIANLLKQNPQDLRANWIKSGGTGKDTITKYPLNIIPGFTPTSASYYQTLFRSSEMYLTAAEAYANLSSEDSARFYLNAIRKRAIPTAVPVMATGQQLLDTIYIERRKELAFEGLRMFDLLRWKKGVSRTDAWTPLAQNLPYPSNNAIAPIPGLDVAQAGLSQNNGY